MKSFIPLSFFAIGAMAQGIAVQNPAPGSTVTPGKSLTVQVIRYNSIEYATEAGLVIGFYPCSTTSCPSALSAIGSIVYNGPFNPQYHGPGQQYENFTVKVPTTLPPGPTAMNVARFFLIGAGPAPTIGDASVHVHVS